MIFASTSIISTGSSPKDFPVQIGMVFSTATTVEVLVCPIGLNRHVVGGEWPTKMDPEHAGHCISADTVWRMGLDAREACRKLQDAAWEAQQEANSAEPPVIVAVNPFLVFTWLTALYKEAGADFPFFAIPQGIDLLSLITCPTPVYPTTPETRRDHGLVSFDAADSALARARQIDNAIRNWSKNAAR